MQFTPDLYDGEATIEAFGESFPVTVQVASGQRRQTVRTMPDTTQTVAVGPRSWFGHIEVPDAAHHEAFGKAVTQAFLQGDEDVSLVLPDGQCGVVRIDDSMWFEGNGPWPGDA